MTELLKVIINLCQIIGTSSNAGYVQERQQKCQTYYVQCVEKDKNADLSKCVSEYK